MMFPIVAADKTAVAFSNLCLQATDSASASSSSSSSPMIEKKIPRWCPKVSPAPAPANETKTPALAPVDTKQNTADAGDLEAKDSETGLKSGQKAGIAIGVIAGIAVVGGGVLVYKKRQQNIQRAWYGYATRGDFL